VEAAQLTGEIPAVAAQKPSGRLRPEAAIRGHLKSMSLAPQLKKPPEVNLRGVSFSVRPEAMLPGKRQHTSVLEVFDTPTGLRQWSPVIRRRIIEANQLQHFVVFCGEYCVQFLAKRDEARRAPKVFKNGIIKYLWITQPKFYRRFQCNDHSVRIMLKSGDHRFRPLFSLTCSSRHATCTMVLPGYL
jgi:hypothetical protein